MIIFLYGPDDYRRIQKKRAIIAEFQKKHGAFGTGYFDLAEEGAADAFTEFARNQSIFDPAKLAVLTNAFELDPAPLAKLLKPLAGAGTGTGAGAASANIFSGTTVLIAERDKPVKALAFLTEKPALSQKFETLAGAEWLSFIKEEAGKAGVRLADAAALFLGTVYAGNSWALVTELRKLSGFKTTGMVDRRDLDAFDLEAAPNYWMLLNGMKSFDARTRLATLERLFALNDPPPKIFNILAAQAGEKTPRMAEYDRMVKTGKLDYEEVLLDLAIS
jgi:DNA polymerase III delta subunit